MNIRIIVTGGTFDKVYSELDGTLSFNKTHVPEMLSLGHCHLDVSIDTIMMVDSLSMTDGDRQRILACCRTAQEQRIVITHGTDTMTETARFLAHCCGDKTVVLTGAMIPYRFGSSDGLFNLGSALAFAQVLPAGVYIAMNGRSFTWDNVMKDKQRGVFQELRSIEAA